MAKDPKKIKLYDVFKLFEREDESDNCPFGGGRCGVGEPCPLHEKLVAVEDAVKDLLHKTTFEDFRTSSQEKSKPPKGKKSKGRQTAKQRRESYRAPPSR